MKIIYNPFVFNHNIQERFAEGPYRINGIEEIAEKKEIDFDVLEYLKKIYSQDYIGYIEEACLKNSIVAETLASEESYKAALASVGLCVIASKQNDFAVTRPPGHHASRTKEAGFCFFNNIAVAVESLVKKGKRVCIIDFDGHHGNGTQEIFYSNNKVLYCSFHQISSYPFSADKKQIGSENAKGLNINIAIPKCSGDDVLLKCFYFIKKYIQFFNPDVIAVSAGFDGYKKDNLLELNFTKRGFYDAGKFISSLNKDVFAVLEGGYHFSVVDCIKEFVNGINKKSLTSNEKSTTSSAEILKLLEDDFLFLDKKLSEFW